MTKKDSWSFCKVISLVLIYVFAPKVVKKMKNKIKMELHFDNGMVHYS